jgi:hypothetical protein
MRKLMWLLPAVALWVTPPAAEAQFIQPYGPRSEPPIPGVGDPFGPLPGVPGLPGEFGPFNRQRGDDPFIVVGAPRPGVPGGGGPFGRRSGAGPRSGPADPFGRPRVPQPGFGRPVLPGPNLPDPWMPPRNLAPPGPLVNPPQDDKHRDKVSGLGAISHVSHIHIPSGEGWASGEKAAFAPKAVRFGEGGGGCEKVGGGGLLAALGGLLRAVFSRGAKKDGGTA